ncbi:MAG: UDP-3-O-(3-hydroxymyristoyl)glucosamine N-acyltransferase [Planctomycetota bacterium]
MTHETAGSLAKRVGGEVLGDPERPIHGVADLRHAGPEHLGFLNDHKLEDAARATKAAALLVKREVETSATQIVVANVYAAFARIAGLFHPVPQATEHDIHERAVVDPAAELEAPVRVGPNAVVEAGCRVGAQTILGPGVVVGAGSTIGRGCVLHAGVVLYPGMQLGHGVILHAGVVIGSDGFGYARDDDGSYVKFPQLGTVVVEDDVEIGANTTVDRGALGATRIGRGSKIDNLVQVAHNCDFGEHVAIAGFCAFSGSTVLGNRVALGGHTVSSGHLRVADDVRVGGNSVIYKDLTDVDDYLGYPLLEKRRWMRTLRGIERITQLQEDVRELKRARTNDAT